MVAAATPIRRAVLSLATIPVVLLGAAAVLAALDALPRLVLGQPRGTTRFASVDEAARRLPRGMLLPAYFPETLVWPASRILARARPPEALLLSFDDRASGRPALLICQSWSSAACPDALLGPLEEFHEVDTSVDGKPARLIAGRAPDGETWEQIAFAWQGRSVTLRLRGRTLDLLRIAGSLREERP